MESAKAVAEGWAEEKARAAALEERRLESLRERDARWSTYTPDELAQAQAEVDRFGAEMRSKPSEPYKAKVVHR